MNIERGQRKRGRGRGEGERGEGKRRGREREGEGRERGVQRKEEKRKRTNNDRYTLTNIEKDQQNYNKQYQCIPLCTLM